MPLLKSAITALLWLGADGLIAIGHTQSYGTRPAGGSRRCCAIAASGFVTPIGPFCPFRSTTCAENGPLGVAMGELTGSKMPRFAEEMSRLQLEMSMGGSPDPQKVGQMAEDLYEAEQQWQRMLARMRLADDFQSREYFKVTAAWSERQGESLESVGAMMRWQATAVTLFAAAAPARCSN
ncbi:hypothetical protein EMIHUDRAFT_230181 [Emiliania huxleyi CCMP1516]|uniref:DUF1311 domain-containing protein n=2 Tax=Emiliania huxleyi TaxID=2903 RepID=A0A0D3KB57_EMIH1|nr:hypothetical protein EMIHUDRAFT_230181 [Emiliania huxleyi CCMP1516]EOD32992.1 hypothetical protein EMIHUDRAFT_230181 [Emiliania huxleyi CCMP1516]|eukprot:XP_005785421.1 hypothetical protein EMIHUDRAFT_230181 [Emiliania huxleyi CCMP1516]